MTDESSESTTSDEVQAAITGAIQDRGFMTLGFVCFAQFQDADGNKGWCIAQADGQLIATTAGLLRIMDMEINHAIHESFFNEDPDST